MLDLGCGPWRADFWFGGRLKTGRSGAHWPCCGEPRVSRPLMEWLGILRAESPPWVAVPASWW